jgi:hypothetical protein
MYVIGIDPGPTPGIVRLLLLRTDRTALLDAQALQVTPGVLPETLDGLAGRMRLATALERFVVGRRAARSATPAAGARTRDMIGQVTAWAGEHGALHLRSAAEVKPWATDARLDAAGLLELTKGMRHARDAARHALFCAVKDYGLPDPLSRKAA